MNPTDVTSGPKGTDELRMIKALVRATATGLYLNFKKSAVVFGGRLTSCIVTVTQRDESPQRITYDLHCTTSFSLSAQAVCTLLNSKYQTLPPELKTFQL
jgi:hypothetical protein